MAEMAGAVEMEEVAVECSEIRTLKDMCDSMRMHLFQSLCESKHTEARTCERAHVPGLLFVGDRRDAF